MGWSTLLEWLGTTRERMEAQRRRGLLWRRWASFIIFIGAIGYTLLQLHAAWITGRRPDWENVWITVFVAGIFAFSPLTLAESRVMWLRREHALALCEAAVDGDDERAPVAEEQPERLPAVERALSFAQVSRVKPVLSSAAQNGLWMGALWLFISVVNLGVRPPLSGAWLLDLLLLCFSCQLVYQGLKGRKKVSVAADAQSFTWSQSRRRVTAEWSDVRAFCRIERSEPLVQSRGTVYYLLATQRDVVLWQRPIREDAEGYAEAERLASLAATYVSVPLRDLTREATRQAATAVQSRSTIEERAHLPPRPAGWKRRTLYPFFATLLVELLLIATCVCAFVAQPR